MLCIFVTSHPNHLDCLEDIFAQDIFKGWGQGMPEVKAMERAGAQVQKPQGSGEGQGKRLQCSKGTLLQSNELDN